MGQNKRQPIYRSISGKRGQYMINIADLEADRKIHILKPSDTVGQLNLIGEVVIPDKLETDTKALRNYVIKELRKLENYVEAKENYEGGAARLTKDDLKVKDLGELYIHQAPSYLEHGYKSKRVKDPLEQPALAKKSAKASKKASSSRSTLGLSWAPVRGK